MPSTYDRTLITDPETVELWADYEAKAKRAAYIYRVMPIAFHNASFLNLCACGRKTLHEDRVCQRCRRAER